MHFTKEEAAKVAVENENLIHHVAKNFNHGTIPYEDIVAAGRFGYAKAIKTYDKTHGAMFSTYAVYCIRNEICGFISNEQKHLESDVSMSAKINNVSDESEIELGDTLANFVEDGADIEGKITLEEDMQILFSAVEQLHPREQFIIEHRYGINGKPQMTQTKVGKILNRSQVSISKTEKQIINKLKGMLQNKIDLESNEYYNNGRIAPVKYLN